jgi:leader peptidase (prepilin peptidase) / N-methyltransferase
MPEPLFLVFMALFGLAIGSFLNVVIVRVPAKESLLSPPSRCPLCETPIKGRDNIPVLSWFLLRGRCRSCREPIAFGYPLVEATNAVLWVVAGVRFGVTGTAVAFAAFFSVLLALSVIDMELQILPDRITLPTALVSVPVLALLAATVTDDAGGALLGALIGGVAYAGVLFVTMVGFELIARKPGMGFGDVKLALSLGQWIGFFHPVLIVYSLIVASVAGLLVGIVYLVVRRKSMPFPFGPWLALGAVIVILFADRFGSLAGLSFNI